MTIYLDLDQTTNVGPYPKFTEPVPGSIETIKDLIRNRHKIVLNTFRANIGQINECYSWLEKHGISSVAATMAKLDPAPYLKAIKYLSGRNSLLLTSTDAYTLYIDDMAKGIHTIEYNGLNVVDWARVREDLINIGVIIPLEREMNPMSTVYVTPGYMKTLDDDEKQAIYKKQQEEKENGENSNISG